MAVLAIDLGVGQVDRLLGLQHQPVEVEDHRPQHKQYVARMAGSIFGSAVRRREDPRLVTGRGRYVDDLPAPGALHAAFARSPHPHAGLRSIDTAAASALPGVVAVFTAADLGLRPRQAFGMISDDFARPPLAAEMVRFVGDAVAVAVTETREQAADAALAVEVDYEPRPALPSAELAAADPANLAFEVSMGNPEEGDPLEDADVVVRQRMANQRLAAVPLEGNAVLAVPEPGGGLTVYASTQSPFQVRDAIADALGLAEEQVRCIAPDVGGGFGAKIQVGAEQVVVAAAAHRLGRPVKWIETRTEGMLAMSQGRGQVQEVALGARRDGTLAGLRAEVFADAGAYPAQGAFLPLLTGQMAPGCYRIPRVDFQARSYATHTTPTSAYRGAGRPEATALIERAMDLLAYELGLDPVELRRRNLVRADEFPFTSATGYTYDSGDYCGVLDKAVQLAGYEELREEQRRRRAARDRLYLGIGVCCYVEVTAAGSPTEFAAVEVGADGGVSVRAGTASHGQGHETAFAMLAAEKLGVEMERVRIIEGDTGEVARGDGTQASRSLQLGGSAVLEACGLLIEKARDLAAARREVAAADLEVAEGGLRVRGVPARALSWAELAAHEPGGLAVEADFFGEPTYPFGCHVAVVEVDSETGQVRLLRHVAVDDCGTILNPLLVEGQVHGGIAQGVAQALFEEVVYDADGTPRSTSLLDYSVPTANEFPIFETAYTVTPTPHNPLGAKGVGESGTIGSTPAVWNAVIDALAHRGIRHLDMPLTPDRVWAALNGS
ncbi:MAG TPA: xanthine dehydrogenase family protein molybdopterin-binding subunit [Candidatus Dormibacteraeota bacterium]